MEHKKRDRMLTDTGKIDQYLKSGVRKYKGKVIPFLLSSCIRSILLLFPSVITGYMIDVIIPKKSISQLVLYSTILVLIPIVSCINIIIEYNATSFIMLLAGKLRVDLFDGIQRKTLEWNEKWKIGDLLNRIVNEVGRIFETIYLSSSFFIWHVITIVVGVFIMMKIDASIGFVITVLLFAKMFLIRFFSRKQQRLYAVLQENKSEMVNLTRESINAIEYIKFSSIENLIFDKFKEKSDELFKRDNASQILRNIGNLINLMITAICIFLIFSLGSEKVIANQLTIGKLVSFYSVFLWSSQAFESFYSLLLNMLGIRPSYERVSEIFFENDEKNESKTNIDRFDNLILDNISFRFGDKTIIDNVSLRICKNEKIAVIGESGAGKSMLSDLIMKFRIPTAGCIYINGNQIDKIDDEWFRKNFLIVSQNTQLRKGTILDNIVFGVDRYDIKAVNGVLETVELKDWINALPDKLNTDIGENKTSISGGERQRIALARALLCKPQFIILDEITSALDNVTASKVVSNLLRDYNQMTIMFITHDKDIVDKMERVIEINNGKVLQESKL